MTATMGTMQGRSLTHKVINKGYYWPKMFDDTKNYVRNAREQVKC